jgi:hypothetical protein
MSLSPSKALAIGLLLGSLAIQPAAALAQGSLQNDNVGCAVDRPCFNGYYQSGNKVIFRFTGITGWDFYNVRFRNTSGGETQDENKSGTFTFNNVKPHSVYTLNVQGCHSHFLGHSTCSPWVSQSVTTK